MAAAMTGTGLTEGGQTAAPEEARSAPGAADGERVCEALDGTRARVPAEPARALEVAGEADFMARIEDAESAAAAGRARPAEDLSAGLREGHLVTWALRPELQPFKDDLDAARRTPPRRSR